MTATQKENAWRLIALLSVLGNIAFNTLSVGFVTFGDDLRVVTERYDALFQPAPYAFGIWSVIYGTFLGYSAYALTPSQRHVDLHDRLSVPLVVANLLCTLWIVAFRYDMIGTSLVIILATVATAIVLYVRSRTASLAYRPFEPVSRFVGVPFSLFLAWLAVAACANFATYLASVDLDEVVLGEASWTMLMLIAAGGLGIMLAMRYRDGLVPAVVAWASFAIAIESSDQSTAVSRGAIGIGILSATAGAYYLLRAMRTKPRLQGGHGFRRFHGRHSHA